ncbi:hypothetical protein [[Limnothrix rosea] IAM M-220]|uniref:hypothetical protein n=1 Tax=[Limnothrix rosea] IAM M-220 TaxID=454133 RepID=UPI0011156E94|nr:hypothetical protein [[Limnothrix rosea] IAM M-220]
MELPDSPEQESNAVFAPPVVETKEANDGSTPAADEKVNASTAAASEAPTPKAPTPAPTTSNYVVDPREFIIAAVKETSAETKAEVEKTSSGASFAETFLLTTGNKSDRRRPGLSMDPFMGLAKTMGSKL